MGRRSARDDTEPEELPGVYLPIDLRAMGMEIQY